MEDRAHVDTEAGWDADAHDGAARAPELQIDRPRRHDLALELTRDWIESLAGGLRHRRIFSDVESYCLFVGYPRSGHTLVGSLLDAHHNTLIAPELDALKYVQAGFSRLQISYLLLRRSRLAQADLQAEPESARRYTYHVPGQWQGRFHDLRVLGDKKGGGSSLRIDKYPSLLRRVRRTLGDRLKVIHVMRNPYDNITTLARRRQWPLEAAVDRYFTLCQAVAATQGQLPGSAWIEARHEDLIADPRETLATLCRFLRLEASPDYLDACAGIVFTAPSRTRFDGPWTDALINAVATRAEAFPFLEGYRYDE